MENLEKYLIIGLASLILQLKEDLHLNLKFLEPKFDGRFAAVLSLCLGLVWIISLLVHSFL